MSHPNGIIIIIMTHDFIFVIIKATIIIIRGLTTVIQEQNMIFTFPQKAETRIIVNIIFVSVVV